MPISEMLAWISIVLSVLILLLTLLARWKIKALGAVGTELSLAELEEIGRLLKFQLPEPAERTVAVPGVEERRHATPPGKAASAPQEYPLARDISAFSYALGRWCEAAGENAIGRIMKSRKLELDGLVRKAMSEHTAGPVEMHFARQSAEIVMAVVSATDKDLADNPHRAALEQQLIVLVDGAHLSLIDPRPGTPLDRELHTSVGGPAGGTGSTQATVRTVLSRGLERPSVARGSGQRVLAKAEVEANY